MSTKKIPISYLLLKYHVFENIMDNGAFALLEQMLHFPQYFQKYSKLDLKCFSRIVELFYLLLFVSCIS